MDEKGAASVANVNPRLIDLVETLVAARLDRLAFDLVEGIRAGRPTLEAEDALAAARELIRGNEQPKARGEPQAIAAEAKPISPDEQIEWAAAYIADRLDEAVEQLQASIETLDFIVDPTIERPDEGGAVAQPIDASKRRTIAVLLDLESARESGPENVAGARESLPFLRAALTEWVTQSRGQSAT